jgi:orotate phosphoribosyltransferase-like protein
MLSCPNVFQLLAMFLISTVIAKKLHISAVTNKYHMHHKQTNTHETNTHAMHFDLSTKKKLNTSAKAISAVADTVNERRRQNSQWLGFHTKLKLLVT